MSNVYKNVSAIVMNINGEIVGPGRELALSEDTPQLEMLVKNGYLMLLSGSNVDANVNKLGTGDPAEEARKAAEAQAAAEAAAQATAAGQATEDAEDADRREFLQAEIERLTGTAVDKRLGLSKLETMYQEAANTK